MNTTCFETVVAGHQFIVSGFVREYISLEKLIELLFSHAAHVKGDLADIEKMPELRASCVKSSDGIFSFYKTSADSCVEIIERADEKGISTVFFSENSTIPPRCKIYQ